MAHNDSSERKDLPMSQTSMSLSTNSTIGKDATTTNASTVSDFSIDTGIDDFYGTRILVIKKENTCSDATPLSANSSSDPQSDSSLSSGSKSLPKSPYDVSTALVEAKITDSDKGYDSAKQLKIIKNKPINRSQSVYTYKSGEIPLSNFHNKVKFAENENVYHSDSDITSVISDGESTIDSDLILSDAGTTTDANV